MPRIETDFLNPAERSPAVWVSCENTLHLFDCARVELTQRFINRLKNVFISHTHVDHFIGFDGVLALSVHAPDSSFRVFGPEGLAEAVSCKIRAYCWNLIPPGSIVITVTEIGDETLRRFRISVPEAIEPRLIKEFPRDDDVVFADGDCVVRALRLNHGIASMGYAFEASDSWNVDKALLAEAGLPEGRWVGELKAQAVRGDWHDLEIEGTVHPIYSLRRLLVHRRGRKIVYLTDFLFEEATLERIAAFARDADVLYCESTYGAADLELAEKNFHLTAGQACLIARAAGAGELVLFHFSARSDWQALVDEARAYFENVR